MPWNRPTLSELVIRIRSDFKSRLGITGALLRRAMASVLAVVWAGAVHMLHGYLEWVTKQLFADTAEREFLVRIATPYGITPTPATFATGTVIATGVNTSIIHADTVLVRDDGATYVVTAEATISGGEAEVSIQASEAGEAGNMDAEDTLSFESPVDGVDSTVTVDEDGISGGFDEEETEAYRQRFILRLQQPPQGGTAYDYQQWALAVAGVTRVWVFPHEDGFGTVTIRFVMDESDPIFPDAGAIDSVEEAIEEKRPVTVTGITVAAPTPLEVDFDIRVSPDTTAVRDAVTAELQDLLFREAEAGDGDGSGTILLSQITTAIGIADGIEDFELLDPTADVVPALGELAIAGDFNWEDP